MLSVSTKQAPKDPTQAGSHNALHSTTSKIMPANQDPINKQTLPESLSYDLLIILHDYKTNEFSFRKELACLGAHVVREECEFNLTTSLTLDHAISLAFTCFFDSANANISV